jgi:hypothetical protein
MSISVLHGIKQVSPSLESAGLATGTSVISGFNKSLIERRAQRAAGEARTVAQAMSDFMSAIEPTEVERNEASKQQQSVRARLDNDWELVLLASYLSGSYRRYTLIRPLDDIDLLVVLDHVEHGITLDSAGAKKALDLIQAALRRAYPKTEMKRHGRCIQIKFAGTGIGFDVVPAVQLSEDEFRIPDEQRGVWIKTNPREVQRLVSDANQQLDGWLVPLVKLVKAFKDEHSAPLTGFHVEAMVYHVLKVVPSNERTGLGFLLRQLSTEVWRMCPDIWSEGERADATLSYADRTRAAEMLANAATKAEQAVAAEAEGRVDVAHGIWCELLGNRYPETGVTRSIVSAMSVADAVRTVTAGRSFSATSDGVIPAFLGYAGVKSASSHGGVADTVAEDEIQPATDSAVEDQREYLEAEIATALAQFAGLVRIDPATAALDPELWPMRRARIRQPYAVLVGEQCTNYGTRHLILVKVPVDLPATAPRVYQLRQHIQGSITGFGRRGAKSSVPRPLRHLWRDGAMCSNSLRDRWDGRLVTSLVYAADWLLRQEHYRRFGRWIGHEIGTDGRHHANAERSSGKGGQSRNKKRPCR